MQSAGKASVGDLARTAFSPARRIDDREFAEALPDGAKVANEAGAKIGLCGQAPSNDPTFARKLVEAGIDTMSVTPDSFLAVKVNVAAAEADG